MLSRNSLRTLCSRANNAFQALRVVSFAVFTTAGASILQRFIRYFFPDTDAGGSAPTITQRASPLQPLIKSEAISKINTTKPDVATQPSQQISAIVKRFALQRSPLSSQLFYHPASPPTQMNSNLVSRVAKFT